MQILQSLLENPVIFAALVLWELALKGITLWKSARKSQKVWFIALLVVNTVGILPIIYLLIEKFQAKNPNVPDLAGK